jgi:hypothetical protein
MLQFGASLTDNASSINYGHNMFIIQATARVKHSSLLQTLMNYKQVFIIEDSDRKL